MLEKYKGTLQIVLKIINISDLCISSFKEYYLGSMKYR